MPPHRRRRTRATPYPNGWLSRRHRRRSRNIRADGGGPPTVLPGDVLSRIFARASSDAADVVRCAATCRRWGLAVATHADAICRALPPPPVRFLTHLALGFFHQENEDVRALHRRRKHDVASGEQPSFVPTASASHLLGPPGAAPYLLGSLFDHARPVASRNGRVVLELRREDRADGLTLCVCNPMTGEMSVLPALSGEDCPGYYACALVTGDDLHVPQQSFFRVLLIYNRRSFTALRTFSSEAGSWGPESSKPGAKISARMLHQLGPAVVASGVAYWPMHREAFGVRLVDGAPEAIMDICSVPYRLPHFYPDDRLLGVSPDGSLCYVYVSFISFLFTINVHTLKQQSMCRAGEWETQEFSLPQLRVTTATALKLRWFNEKSGTVLFTVGEGGGATSGAFVLSLATGSLEKLAGGVECHHAWRNVCGYEMDRAALLASIPRF